MSDILLILLFVFLFYGEPDVWDKLHERAMHNLEQPNCSKELK